MPDVNTWFDKKTYFYGDNAIDKYGDDAVDALKKYGDDAAEGFKNGKTPGEIKGKTNSVRIVNETDYYIDYCNEYGTIIRANKQNAHNINNAIDTKLNSSESGPKYEATVADYIRTNTNCTITDFDNSLKIPGGDKVGDIDCATKYTFIECKTSAQQIKPKQFEKYVDTSNINYMNFENKQVVICVKDKIDYSDARVALNIKKAQEMGIIIINNLDDLKGVLK